MSPVLDTDLDNLGERIATHAAHLDAATHTLLTDLRAFDNAGGWHKQGFRTCSEWLSWRVGWSPGTSREHVRVANRLADLPRIDDALRRGAISYCKVRAITRVATPANEEALLTDAEFSTGAQLERICRKYAAVLAAAETPDEACDRDRRYVRRVALEDGMVKLEAVLHAEEAALVWAALDAVARARTATPPTGASPVDNTGNASPDAGLASDEPRDDDGDTDEDNDQAKEVERAAAAAADRERAAAARADNAALVAKQKRAPFHRADALLEIAQASLRGEQITRTPVELVITVPAETLAHPTTAAAPFGVATDGSCVSAETARRLACDCGVVHVCEDESGKALSVGRKTRTIPSSLKRALLHRDSCCQFPGCNNRVFLEGHHIQHWADGGETRLDNLVLICTHHHRFVHEYAYRIELDDQRQPRFFDARGRLVVDVPARPTLAVPGMRTLRERNRDLGVSAETNQPKWDGSPVDYGLVVDDLLKLTAG